MSMDNVIETYSYKITEEKKLSRSRSEEDQTNLVSSKSLSHHTA